MYFFLMTEKYLPSDWMPFLIRKLLIKWSTSNFKIFPNCRLRFQEPSYGINKDMDKPKIQDTGNVLGKNKTDIRELL